MRNSVSKLWPCISEAGLDLFAATADQRYLLGQELFLSTHYPVTFRRFGTGNKIDSVKEADVLNALIRQRSNVKIGNRVFVLYGAAGSGKSETIRWLQLKMEQRQSRHPDVIVRISRTDLDVLQIIERFQHLLSKKYFTEVTHARWEEARRKPRTLAKLLLLAALERTLDSDELVNALYYRLLEWIQPRISRILNATNTPEGKSIMPVEVLTREDLEQLKAETSLPAQLDYEQFRYHLLLAFRETLLEGVHLPTILKLISDDLIQKGQRPILLIDDLVQSINLFATDLLDYFITLENGNWDVVIGITPDAMTDSERGRELLDRITYLDTVDDRVVKLWLSDLRGADSYFLSTENCVDFAALYLTAFREQNGWKCKSCPHFKRCQGLGASRQNRPTLLAPFNPILLQRIYQSLPENKGKTRQFLLRLKVLLGGLIESQDLVSTLTQFIPPEMAVEAKEPRLARLAELYAPLPKNGKIALSSGFLRAIGLSGKDVILPAQPLQKMEEELPHSPLSNTVSENDPARTAIKSWLDGKEVNRQSLLGLRRGIARWLRMTCFSTGFHADGIANPHHVLRPHNVYLGVTPPILLEGVDEGQDGICIERAIGLNAFLFQEFALSQGSAKNSLLFKIAQSNESWHLIYQASIYRHHLQAILEEHLEMPLEQFAFTIYLWSIVVQREESKTTIPGIDYQKVKKWRQQRPAGISHPKAEIVKWSAWFFEDFFKLRENIFNGPSIAHYMAHLKLKDFFGKLESIKPITVETDYLFGNLPFCEILIAMQETVAQFQNPSVMLNERARLQSEVIEALTSSGRKGVRLSRFPISVWEGIEADQPDFFSTLQVTAKP